MNKEKAQKLKIFKNYCTCGGFAWNMNGRDKRRPHMSYCPQREEYNEWYDALHGDIEMSETVKLVPLINDKQEVVLYDMYIDGQWHGSRTTKWQAEMYIKHALDGKS